MKKRLCSVLSLPVLVWSVAAHAQDYKAWLTTVEGFYASERNPTPFGEIPFAMDMTRQPDGSVHGRTWANRESYFDFKFYVDEKDSLLFHETGALPGGQVQPHVLEVVKLEGSTITFETKQRPGLLVAIVTADGNRFQVNALVRGKPHADLRLTRVTSPEAIAAFRAANAQNKNMPPPAPAQVAAKPQNLPNDGKADPKTFADYAGDFQLPAFVLRVTREGDRLFAQPQEPGSRRQELKPQDDGTFSVTNEPFILQFVRAADGKIAELVVHLPNGQSMRARKVAAN